jgi:predicted ATPase
MYSLVEESFVLFLDDIQWAGANSLSLLQKIFLDSPLPLFVVLSYRINEVDTVHPVSEFFNSMKHMNIPSHKLLLEDLSKENVSILVSQMLNIQGRQPIDDLVEAVMCKTHGNPFFVTQVSCFTKNSKLTLVRPEKLIYYDYDTIISSLQNFMKTVICFSILALMWKNGAGYIISRL